MKCCCMNCEERTPNCHAWCDRYKAWTEKNQERLKEIELERVRNATIFSRYLAKLDTLIERKKKGLKT